MTETLVQLLLAGMLLLTVVWCTLVHRRLKGLHADRGEMEAFIEALTVASGRAEAAIHGLRQAGEAIAAELTEREQAARRAGDALARLTQAAGRGSARLETAGRPVPRALGELTVGARRPGPPPAEPSTAAAPIRDAEAAPGGPSRITAELMKTLQGLR